ncbi:MAG: glycosyltransferase family 39 protein [Dehalococcoidales bacterium]|nr:glycosyltransferase family 39 protein [Dehalococcoidales bacterium]
MKKKIAGIIELSYLPLAVVFLLLVLLTESGILTLPIKYEVFAYVLPLLAIPTLIRFKTANEQSSPVIFYLLFVSLIFSLGIRLLPLVRSSIPLGYDPGIYKYTMELYYNALPGIPEGELATWVKQTSEQGLFVLSDAMHILAGTSAMDNIVYLFPFFGTLLILPLFVVTRNLFGPRVGVIASLLYAVSYTQYSAFTLLYYKNVIGLMLLLLAIYALEKRKDGLMALMFAGLGIFHRPEFLLFALILVPYLIFNRDRRGGVILAVMGAALLIAPFWIPRWEAYWETVSGGIGAGTLFGFSTYTMVALAYLPFAVMGAVYLVINKRLNSVVFYFVITCSIVVFQILFFNRFIIMLDLAMIILAAVGVEHSLLQKKGVRVVAGAATVLLVLLASGLPTMTEANNIMPRVDKEQLEAIEWISENTESNAYVLATSSDAPWVLGWSERRVIAPGLFEWYIQGKEEWFRFFDSKDPEVAKEFLAVYDSPIYVYSRATENYPGLEKFEGDYFQQVYKSDGAVVFRYSGEVEL